MVLDHAARDEVIGDVRKGRQRRLDHQRLAYLEDELPAAKLVADGMRHREDSVARQAVGRRKVGSRLALAVGGQRGVPVGAGQKVLAHALIPPPPPR